MHAIHLFASVVLLVAISNVDSNEGITIHISGPVKIIIGSGQEGHEAVHCSGGNGLPDKQVIADVCEDNWPGICIDGIKTFDNGTTTDVGGCSCGGIKKSGWCDSPKYGQRLCRKTCGYCGDKGCPKGFFMLSGSKQCFKLITDEKITWEEAKNRCTSEGFHLAEPSDAIAVTLRKYLQDTYGDTFAWLGARGDGSTVVWESSDHTPLSNDSPLWSPYYGPEYPPGVVNTETCLALWSINGPEYPYAAANCIANTYDRLCEASM